MKKPMPVIIGGMAILGLAVVPKKIITTPKMISKVLAIINTFCFPIFFYLCAVIGNRVNNNIQNKFVVVCVSQQ